jgi:hypothetical protein
MGNGGLKWHLLGLLLKSRILCQAFRGEFPPAGRKPKSLALTSGQMDSRIASKSRVYTPHQSHCPKYVLSVRRQNSPLTYIPIGCQLLRVNTERFSAPMLLLPSPGISHTKSVIVNLSDLLEWHPFHFRVCENDEQPSEGANPGIKPKSTTRRHALHHGEECRCNDDVCAPARNGVLFFQSQNG